MKKNINVAVLVSGGGTNLQAIIDFSAEGKLESGKIVLNEPNTLPGFTNISMYPMLAKKHGFDLPALIDKLIESV